MPFDPLDPFGEEVKKAPGQEMQEMAGEFSHFVKQIGGPRLNEDAVATILVDLRTWWKSWSIEP